ncbi:thermonuclease family protein [Peteryoungia ipomoeae]|nr:thermonuclease family protein [Peteryoungia ipomoeae]
MIDSAHALGQPGKPRESMHLASGKTASVLQSARRRTMLSSVQRMFAFALLALMTTGTTSHAASQNAKGLAISGTFTICGAKKRINCIVDGDTFWYRGEKYRISDINTPEVSQPACEEERRLGKSAQSALLKEFNAGGVRLIKAEKRDVDRYDRKLRVAMRGDQSIGQILVRRGLAHKWEGRKLDWCGSRPVEG